MGNSSTRLGTRLSGVSASLVEALPNSALHVVMLGLDSAGKTTVLYRLKLDQYVNTVPTIGFNCEKVKGCSGGARGVSFLIWDVGGQDKLRPLWRSYTRCTDAIVFVVDSVDAERIEEARTELFKTLKVPENSGVPVLVLANKQDLPGALEVEELEEKLSLREMATIGHLWDVATCCAITGDGLEESLDKLHELVTERRRQIKDKEHRPGTGSRAKLYGPRDKSSGLRDKSAFSGHPDKTSFSSAPRDRPTSGPSRDFRPSSGLREDYRASPTPNRDVRPPSRQGKEFGVHVPIEYRSPSERTRDFRSPSGPPPASRPWQSRDSRDRSGLGSVASSGSVSSSDF